MTSQRSRHKRSGDEVSAIILENAGREAGLRGNMAAMWREGRYTDLEVVVEGRSLHMHRVVVSAESEYMKRVCESDQFVEGRSCRVELAELAADAVEHAVGFMYEGRCTLPTADKLESVLMVASFLQIATLTEAAVNAIADRMTSDSCCDWMALGDRLSLSALTLKAKECALRCFANATSASGFATLPAPLLAQILKSQNLRVKDEGEVFTALVRWVDAQPQKPPHEITEALMKYVRFSHMDAEFLKETVEVSPLVQQHAFVVMQAHREAVTKESTVRTVRRSQLRFEDLKIGMKVRIMDDEDYVKAQCDRPAPGANDAVQWVDEMEAIVGEVCTIKALITETPEGESSISDSSMLAAVVTRDAEDEGDRYWVPFHVLERE